jgi:hypothetical protein
MLVVILAGLVMGGCVWRYRMGERSNYYRGLAAVCKKKEYPYRSANSLTEAERFAALARKYERAARYPWLPVEPDPPEP